MKSKISLWQMGNELNFIVILAFLIFASINLFSNGMFMDGTIYAAVSNNLANGEGTLFSPKFTETLYPYFVEHPPLAFWLQGLFFYLFGDHFLVERFYCLITILAGAYLLIQIWRSIGMDLKTAFIPLFVWLFSRDVAWGFANNMLENTMTVFILWSFLYLAKYYFDQQKIGRLLLAGLFLSMACATKGFVALYLWSVPFFAMLFLKEKFISAIWQSMMLILSTVLPLLLLFLLSPEAADFMNAYFEKQVVGSLENIQTVDSRFFILGAFLQNLIVPILIIAIWLFVRKKFNAVFKVDRESRKRAAFFICIALSGVIPIMISMKQRDFYIFSVYPFVGLAIGTLLASFWNTEMNAKRIRNVQLILSVLFIASIITASNLRLRDKHELSLIDWMAKEYPEKQMLGIAKTYESEWSLHAYFMRFNGTSLKSEISEVDLILVPADIDPPQTFSSEPIYQNDKYAVYQKMAG